MNEWSMPLTPKVSRSGSTYRARVFGFERPDRMWEGRIEFQDDAGQSLMTGHETTQPNLTTLQYWATGLEEVYLQGALQRATPKDTRGKP